MRDSLKIIILIGLIFIAIWFLLTGCASHKVFIKVNADAPIITRIEGDTLRIMLFKDDYVAPTLGCVEEK